MVTWPVWSWLQHEEACEFSSSSLLCLLRFWEVASALRWRYNLVGINHMHTPCVFGRTWLGGWRETEETEAS